LSKEEIRSQFEKLSEGESLPEKEIKRQLERMLLIEESLPEDEIRRQLE